MAVSPVVVALQVRGKIYNINYYLGKADMPDIKTFFTEDEKMKINLAVTDAEKKTSAEIVPVLTDSSGGYDRAEDIFGLTLAILSVIVIWVLFQGIDSGAAWSTAENPALKYSLPFIVLTVIGAFIIGAAIAGKVWCARNIFCSRALMKHCVQQGAARAFHIHGLSKTQGATGIVIYISLFERMVHVFGDTAIAEKLSDADFEEVKDAIVSGLRSGKRGEGVCEGIRLCGEKLAAHFPIKEGDVDELSNELIIWEQNL